jgi:hypothetical protein
MADLYTIVGQRPMQDVGTDGTLVPAIEVTFTTKPSGVLGRVRIPAAQYSPDVVNMAVTEQARTIEAVQAL